MDYVWHVVHQIGAFIVLNYSIWSATINSIAVTFGFIVNVKRSLRPRTRYKITFFVLFLLGISLHLASIFFCQPWNNPPDLRKFQFWPRHYLATACIMVLFLYYFLLIRLFSGNHFDSGEDMLRLMIVFVSGSNIQLNINIHLFHFSLYCGCVPL